MKFWNIFGWPGTSRRAMLPNLPKNSDLEMLILQRIAIPLGGGDARRDASRLRGNWVGGKADLADAALPPTAHRVMVNHGKTDADSH
jgi:hypothetical protein